MRWGDVLNLYGSLLAFTGCVAFVVVYTVMAFVTGRERWWSSHVGRMMVTKALAIAGLMAIALAFYWLDLDTYLIRQVRGVFAGVVGVMMIYQTVLVYRLQKREDDDS